MNTTRVTITEAAQILGRKPDILKKWIQEGCPHEKEGDSVRLSIAALFDWNSRRSLTPAESMWPRTTAEIARLTKIAKASSKYPDDTFMYLQTRTFARQLEQEIEALQSALR